MATLSEKDLQVLSAHALMLVYHLKAYNCGVSKRDSGSQNERGVSKTAVSEI